MTMGAFLAAAAGPLAKRVMSALGFGVVTFVGVSAALNQVLDLARSAWAGIPGDIAVYIAMSGANTALAIIAGAAVTRVALMQLKRLALL